MDKLQYDSLYKFLVSLGLILIALPFVAMIYIFNVVPILLDQTEYDALSDYSLRLLLDRENLYEGIISIFPGVSLGIVAIGVCLLAFGIYKWYKNQKNLDDKLDAETTMQVLRLFEMNENEVDDKVTKEVKEVATISPEEIDALFPEGQQTMRRQYENIEKMCFNYFLHNYSRRYNFTQNICMGQYEYDLIGVSKKGNIDLLVEIKYWTNIDVVSRSIGKTYKLVKNACINYETIAHRNFEAMIFIVVPDKQLPQIKSWIEQFEVDDRRENYRIKIKCIGENSLLEEVG